MPMRNGTKEQKQQDDENVCDGNATCLHTGPTTHNCTCNPGYVGNGALCNTEVLGCTNATAYNFNSTANRDDGSCVPAVVGCTNSTMLNYDAHANTDNGACIPIVRGCTDPSAFNHHPDANVDDGTCIAVMVGCTNATAPLCTYPWAPMESQAL